MNYYNEIDPYAAQWLRNLIAAGHIPAGVVDTRSIVDVKPEDVYGYAQAHFFAGIGGWSYALRIAGWPDARPVWTGSCPCQPFSSAGKRRGKDDERHLWPVWFNLIRKCRPAIVFGEQVAGAITHGWWDDVSDDLEREGYEAGAAILPACSVDAPHKRDRLWFVGISDSERRGKGEQASQNARHRDTTFATSTDASFMANATSCGWKQGDALSGGLRKGTPAQEPWSGFTDSGCQDVADTYQSRLQGRGSRIVQERPGECIARTSSASVSNTDSESQERITESRSECSFWQSEPAVGRVANGIPARTHKLRAYGNAIVPQVAAEFIKACMLASL